LLAFNGAFNNNYKTAIITECLWHNYTVYIITAESGRGFDLLNDCSIFFTHAAE